MLPQRLTTSARVAQVRAAILRVKQAHDHFRYVSGNSPDDTFSIESARAALVASVAECGWQWENVEAVLDALAPEGQ